MTIYFITPKQKTFTEITNDNFNNLTENSNSPLLIVIGWSGSAIKQLGKYYEIYRNKGFNCILSTTTIDPSGLFLKSNGKKLTNILDVYLKKNIYCNDIITHYFSSGGNVYMCLMGEINNNKNYQYMQPKFKGQIADSSPPYTIKGCIGGLYKSMITGGALTGLATISLPFFIPFYYLMLTNSKYSNNQNNQMYTLVLHSKKDNILLDSVPAFINDLKKYTTNYDEFVKVKYFNDSNHVSHYIKYQNEYINEISIFISKILNNNSQLLINSKL